MKLIFELTSVLIVPLGSEEDEAALLPELLFAELADPELITVGGVGPGVNGESVPVEESKGCENKVGNRIKVFLLKAFN